MYFNVYADSGASIEGYLIPDGFSGKPSVIVMSGGERFGPFKCDIFLPGPYHYKHHQTGIVGFQIDEAKLPNISAATDLEISDADTGFVFYRRIREEHIRKRVFRLETQFAPHSEFDISLQPHFQFFASGAEKYGSETVRQMLEITNQPSTYVSGRVMFKGVKGYLTDDTVRIVSVRDPFYELGLRLWSLASVKRRPLSFITERDSMLFEPAIAYLSDTNFTDPDHIKKKIISAPREVVQLFASPFVQQLIATSPTDKVSRDDIPAALDTLSQFTIFSGDEHDDRVAIDAAEIFGLDPTTLSFSTLRSQFLELAGVLRQIPVVEHVLENDLILFHFINKATKRAQ